MKWFDRTVDSVNTVVIAGVLSSRNRREDTVEASQSFPERTLYVQGKAMDTYAMVVLITLKGPFQLNNIIIWLSCIVDEEIKQTEQRTRKTSSYLIRSLALVNSPPSFHHNVNYRFMRTQSNKLTKQFKQVCLRLMQAKKSPYQSILKTKRIC